MSRSDAMPSGCRGIPATPIALFPVMAESSAATGLPLVVKRVV
jgi:hypothetical protein